MLIVFDAHIGFDHNYSIIGTRGYIHTDKNKRVDKEAHSFATLASVPGSMDEQIEIPVSTHFAHESANGHGGADVQMIKEFVDCILNDTEPPISLDLAIRMTLPGIIAAQSEEQGGAWLEIPDIT